MKPTTQHQNDLALAYKRLHAYIQPTNNQDGREKQYILTIADIVQDIYSFGGAAELRRIQEEITSTYALTAPSARRKTKIVDGVDIALARNAIRIKKAKTKTSGSVVGSVSYTDILRLTNIHQHTYTLDDQHANNLQPAALVYCLIKQGALVLTNVDLPYNAELIYAIKQQAPALHKFLLTDHVEALRTNPQTSWILCPTDAHGVPTPFAPIPDDATVQETMDALYNQDEFTVIGEAFNKFLQYIATIPVSIEERIAVRLNQDQLPRKPHGSLLTPSLFCNSMASKYALATCSLSRIMLASTINRPDLWAAWRGDNDKRYYAEHGRYATRGSKNRLFGWMTKRLDYDLNLNTETDCNPYRLLALSLERTEDQKPYKRTYDTRTAWERLIEDTPAYDTAAEEWCKGDPNAEEEEQVKTNKRHVLTISQTA